MPTLTDNQITILIRRVQDNDAEAVKELRQHLQALINAEEEIRRLQNIIRASLEG